MSHTRKDEERLFKRIEEQSERTERRRKRIEDRKFDKLINGGKMMGNKIRNKLEELILEALNDNKIELAKKLIDLRINIARVEDLENR